MTKLVKPEEVLIIREWVVDVASALELKADWTNGLFFINRKIN